MMLHPTQELEPPANPARFRSLSFEIKNYTGNELQVFGILGVPNVSVTCQQTVGSWKKKADDGPVSTIRWLPTGATGFLDCTIAQSGTGQDAKLPETSIQIRTAAKSFTYDFPEITLNPKIPPPPPLFERYDLSGKAEKSQARWSDNAHHETKICTAAELGIPSGLELIISNTSEQKFSRGTLACQHHPDFCDSAGEECSNWIIVEGCAVNSEFIQYARDRAQARGIVFNRNALCTQ